MKEKNSRLVYTSDPAAAARLRDAERVQPAADKPAAAQTIRVSIDRKRRRGKSVTVASGFTHRAESLAELAAALKKKCGAGGTAKENEIEIQGEHVAAVIAELESRGYRTKKV